MMDSINGTPKKNGNGLRAWIDLLFRHFWKVAVVVVVVLWLLGKLPLDPKDLIDFIKEMKQ